MRKKNRRRTTSSGRTKQVRSSDLESDERVYACSVRSNQIGLTILGVTMPGMKVEKRQFDAVLDKLIAGEPEKRSEVKPSKNRKPRKARKSSARGARRA